MRAIRIVLLTAMVLAPIAFAGCGDDGNPASPVGISTSSRQLQGTWIYRSVAIKRPSAPITQAQDDIRSAGAAMDRTALH